MIQEIQEVTGEQTNIPMPNDQPDPGVDIHLFADRTQEELENTV